jgi:hypothetical protein
MEKIWDYLPLIIGLLYLFGRSRKKNKQRVPEQPEQSEPEISVEEVLRELMGGKKQEVVPPPVVVQEVPRKVQQPKKVHYEETVDLPKPFTYDDPKIYEKLPSGTDLHKPLKGLIETTEHEPIEIDLSEAIIYSTILDRPKY